MVAVAPSFARAAVLFGTTQQTVQRSGGIWGEGVPAPAEITQVLENVLADPGSVYSYVDDKWKLTQKSSVARDIEAQVQAGFAKRGSWTAEGNRLPCRLIKLTPEEIDQIHRLGGATWVRNAIQAAAPSEAIAQTRRKGADLKLFSIRIADADWKAFQALGGVAWLRNKLENS